MNEKRHETSNRLFLVMIGATLLVSVAGLVVELLPERDTTAGEVTARAPSTVTTGEEQRTTDSLPGGASRPPVAVNETTDNVDGLWRFDTAESVGLDPRGVEAYLELCRRTGADAVLVARGNTIVGEWYSDRYNGSLYAMSSTKSVTGLLVGIAQDRGLLHVSDRVGRYVASWNTGLRGEVTIEHLLTQTSGLLQQSGDESVGMVADKNDYVIGLEPDIEPGERFSYSNEGVQLLSPVLAAATGGGVDDFAETYLFGPLGMESTRFHVSGENRDVWTYADMETTPRDFARLGLLVLDDGAWNGEQVISSEYLGRALGPSPRAENYGYLWWRLIGDPSLPGVAALGYLSTDMYVLPDHDLLVVRMQAPRTRYTGEAEEAPYSQGLVWVSLRAILGMDDPDAAWEAVSAIPER